jgi:hypothetical protein
MVTEIGFSKRGIDENRGNHAIHPEQFLNKDNSFIIKKVVA